MAAMVRQYEANYVCGPLWDTIETERKILAALRQIVKRIDDKHE